MAETQPPAANPPQGDAPKEDALQQPSDAVLMKDLPKDTPQEPAEPLSLPAPAEGESSSSSAPEATSPKGKSKDELPPSEPQREDDFLSIGPSDPPAGAASPSNEPRVCTITLLLPTGARHPYRLDEKYLAKRNVEVPDVTESGQKDPFSISIYKLKELILREWRDEWENKPASPSSIRLIFFGKMLDDKEQLKKYQFSAESPNIVHMSVRPPDMLEEDEAAKGKTTLARAGVGKGEVDVASSYEVTTPDDRRFFFCFNVLLHPFRRLDGLEIARWSEPVDVLLGLMHQRKSKGELCFGVAYMSYSSAVLGE